VNRKDAPAPDRLRHHAENGRFAIQTSIADIDVKELHPDLHKGFYVLLTVSYKGAGMDERTKNHLFWLLFTTKEGGSC
jgi:hypothetical protein